MVAIRLNRQGSTDRPYYKIVVVDSRARRDGDFIEQVGTYNPMAEGVNYTLDLEKVEKWISNGAQPSETVASMIKKARINFRPGTALSGILTNLSFQKVKVKSSKADEEEAEGEEE